MTPWWLPLAAWAVDWAVGDPPRPTHPTVLIGRAIAWAEHRLHPPGNPAPPAVQRVRGIVLAGAVTLGTAAGAALAVRLAAAVHPWLGTLAEIWLFATALAGTDLARHARDVWRPLTRGDLPGARRAVGRIVGRDTDVLDREGVVRAAVEAVAESTVDGAVAPLFWGALGGAPLALAYRAVNTLDSMCGHLDERYRYFGWASARLDDVANFLPARVAVPLLAAAAALAGLDGAGAWRTARRDGRRHPSPNAGLSEAALAGALGVQLGGTNYYGGEPEHRPHLGDPLRALEPEDIRRAVRVMRLTVALAAAAAAAALAAVTAWQRRGMIP